MIKNKKIKVLVVGGTGFIGYHLARHCLKLNWKVSILSISPPKKMRFISKANYYYGDISKKNKLKFLKKLNFDYVVNCGGYVDHINKNKTYNTHYIGCKNLYKIFSNKNIKSFIQIGSSSEYGKLKSPHKEVLYTNPTVIYGKSKLLASKFLIKKYISKKFPVTILRFYQVYGPKQDLNRFIPILINSSLKGLEFECSKATQSRDFLYIDDAISAIIGSLKKRKAKGKIFNIASGKPIVLKKIINYVFKKVGKGKPLFGRIPLRVDEPKIIYPKITHSRKVINWKPKINFEKGLTKTINYYKRNKI